MRAGWQTRPLVDLCKVFADGDWIESKDQSQEGIRLIQTGNVGEGVFKDRGEKARYISEATFSKLRCTEIFKGDCLVSRLPDPVGRSCILPDTEERMITAVDCTILRFDTEQITPEFFNYYTQSSDYLDAVDGESTGTTRKRVSRSKLGQTPVPVPPLPEQQRIVGILDDAFVGIATAKANAEQNLQNARALFESHLQSVFTQHGEGWVETTLNQATDGIFTGPFGSLLHKSDYVANGIPLVNPAHITEIGIEPDLRKTVSKETASRLKNYIMHKGDIVIGRRGEMGRCALVTEVEDGWLCGTGSFFIKPSSRCDTRYLVRFLRSESCKARLEKIAGGAVMPNLSNTDLAGLQFNLPPLDIQKDIVRGIDELHEETQRLESLYQRKLAALDELKKSILHDAFAGKLTEQSRQSVVIPFPTAIPGITTTDLHAGILAISYERHEQEGKQKHFGHVKAEKIAHMIEAHVGIDLGRAPIKDAAGPNDYPHLKRVEHRAKMAGFFDFQRVEKAGYRVTKYRQFGSLIERVREKLGDRNRDVESIIELMLPMDSQQAEIFCTVYAAWNNLLLDRQEPDDESIVYEARENWHPDKLNIPRERFFAAIGWMRQKGVVPVGKGKQVRAKA